MTIDYAALERRIAALMLRSWKTSDNEYAEGHKPPRTTVTGRTIDTRPRLQNLWATKGDE